MSGYRRMMGHRDAAQSHLQALPWPSGGGACGSGWSSHPRSGKWDPGLRAPITDPYTVFRAPSSHTSLTQGPGLASRGQGG